MGYGQLSVVLLFVFLCQLVFSSSQCHKDESISLLKFKETLTVEPSASAYCVYHNRLSYPKTSSWNVSRDCCSWDGVICAATIGYVIGLDLGCSQLAGKIDSNSTLFELSHLEYLDLSWNDFSTSHISPNFGRFRSLMFLDLTSSHFSGQITSEISYLSELQCLRLFDNELRLAPQDFKLLLQNLTQLRELSLQALDISSTIPTNVSSHLTTLRLDETELHGIIPESIFHLPNLEVLTLVNNSQLNAYFPKIKWNSSASLVCLDLSYVNILSNLPESLSYLTSLSYLSLSHCNLQGPIPESILNLTRIEFLSVEGNSLNGTIPSCIFSLPALSNLDLSYNHFSGQLEEFKSNSLVWINLGGNQLQGHIPKSIQNLVNLKTLDLSSNNFSGHVDVTFFSNLKHLWNLDLSYNRISLTNENKVNFTWPESLKYLQLAACEIKNLGFLRSAKNLVTLDLSNNKIQGRIPDWAWSNWESLTNLNFSHNMLTSVDSIPLSYVYMIDLRSNLIQGSLPILPNSIVYFFISKNNLSDGISSSICKLKLLQILDLARNNLKREIPQCLGNISGLQVLDMHNNNLSGTLPTTFSFGSLLRSLNLHGNELEGKIPRSLINCKELQVLDLGDNHLNDTFPMWLGTLPSLQVLSLRSNELHGPIRISRNGNKFPELRIIDLSYNAFSENLPTSLFQQLKAMKIIDQTIKSPKYLGNTYYQDSITVVTKGLQLELVRILTVYTTIDLSNNRFGGQIPIIMGDLVALHVLNLSNNELQGHIPPSLGDLSLIESLDLSVNQLSGKIPEQLASDLTFLEFLNLSHNHLERCIPQGPQFATFQKNSYEGNDRLRGFPVSKGCGSNSIPETNNTIVVLDQAESNSTFLSEFSWKEVLIGYGCGLSIGFCIAYFMLSARKPNWLSWITEELEYKIVIMRRRKKQRNRQMHNRR